MGCLTSEQFELLRRAAAPSTDLAAWWRHIDTCDACARRIVEGTRRFASQQPTILNPGSAGLVDSDDADATTSRSGSRSEPLPEIPGYQLVREVHRGAQGVVYLAIQISTRREVAVKVMLQGPFAGPDDRARFEREVSILARLEHPNIVTIHDSGVAYGAHYFVMRYVAGVALDAWLANNGDDRERLLRLFIDTCDAVEAAHATGVVHRDLKPGNIRVGPDGRPAVLDFGLAKVAGSGGPDALAMTQTGQFMGSVPWASPEQAAGDSASISPRSDVYSIGVMLFHALTGVFPYSVEGNVRDVLDRVRFSEPLRPSAVLRGSSSTRTPRGPAIDRELDTIVLTCLRKEPGRRYASAGAVAADLRRYLAGEAIEARGESLSYVVASRARRLVRRNPLAASLAGIALATTISLVIGIPLAFHWTPAQRWFERVAFASMPSVRAPRLSNVTVIDLHRDIDPAVLARAAGVQRPEDPNERRWLRAVHGALMVRLATAKPRLVAWDFSFLGASEYDDAFVRGVEQLGAPVLVALPTWAESAGAMLSPSIARVAASGCAASGFGPRGWSAFLALQRGDGEPLRSLALEAYVLSRRPDGATTEVRVDPRDDMLEIRYWSSATSGERRTSLGVYRLRATAIRPPGPDTAGKNGIEPTDLIVHAFLAMPSEAALATATVRYEEVFSMSDDALFRTFSGRVILVGDSRNPAVHLAAEGGGTRWATYGHAAAIEQLCSGAGVVVPGRWEGRLMAAGFAGVGLMLGRRRPDAMVLRIAVYVAGGVISVALCIAMLWAFGLLYSPVVALLAFAAAIAFGELLHTARARGASGIAGSGSSTSREA